MRLFERKRSDYTNENVSGTIKCVSGDILYISKGSAYFTMTIISQRGALKGSLSLDYDNIKQMMWFFGALPAGEYAPKE